MSERESSFQSSSAISYNRTLVLIHSKTEFNVDIFSIDFSKQDNMHYWSQVVFVWSCVCSLRRICHWSIFNNYINVCNNIFLHLCYNHLLKYKRLINSLHVVCLFNRSTGTHFTFYQETHAVCTFTEFLPHQIPA